jgi:hypothetical protein
MCYAKGIESARQKSRKTFTLRRVREIVSIHHRQMQCFGYLTDELKRLSVEDGSHRPLTAATFLPPPCKKSPPLVPAIREPAVSQE